VGEIFRRTIVSRGRRPLAIVIALLAILVGFLSGAFGSGGAVDGLAVLPWIFALYAGIGLVGRDVRDGSVQLVLARPLTRNQYLAGRLLGVAALGMALAAVTFAAAMLVSLGRGQHPSAALYLAGWLNFGFGVVWMWSVIFLFSVFIAGSLDFLGYFAMIFVGAVLAPIASLFKNPYALAAARWLSVNLGNSFQLRNLSAASLDWAGLLRWGSNVVLALFVGTLIFNARQFSYGSES
jgi:ABC-type transport system involved in multi-copper enzyme maturation permease subunit